MYDGWSAQLRSGARLAQWLEHQTFNLRVMGSNPVLGVLNFFYHITICN